MKRLGGYIPTNSSTRVRPKGTGTITAQTVLYDDEQFMSHAARELEYVRKNFTPGKEPDYKEIFTSAHESIPVESETQHSVTEQILVKEETKELFETPHMSSIYADARSLKGFVVEEKKQKQFISFLERLLQFKVWIFIAVIAVSATGFFYIKDKIAVKDDIIRKGTAGYKNLLTAKDALATFDFTEAREQFAFAASNFKEAKDDLDGLSMSFIGFADIFSGTLGDAQNLNEAAELLSQSGAAVTETLTKLNNINFFTFLSEEPEQNPLKNPSAL